MYGTMYGYLHTQNTPGRMTLESGSKRASCLSVCHPTVQSSSWGMLCLQSAQHSSSTGPPSPQPPSPPKLENNAFFSRATPAATSDQLFRHVLPQEVFKNLSHGSKIRSRDFTLFHAFPPPPSQLDVLILKILEHKSVRIFPCRVRQGCRASQAF